MEPPTQTTIFSQSNKRSSRSGFTLVEILIVMAIISFILAMGLPTIQRVTYQQLNSTSRRFIGTLRTIRNDSILLSNIHRLVVDIDDQAWWVENQRRFQLLSLEPTNPAEEEDPEGAASNFSPVEKYSTKPVRLPDGVIFEGIFKEREGFVNEGKVYIHFFPNGYTEPAILFLNRPNVSSNAYAIELKAPLGKVEVYRESVENFLKK